MKIDRSLTVLVLVLAAFAEACAHHVVAYDLGPADRVTGKNKVEWSVGVERPAFNAELAADANEGGRVYTCNPRSDYERDIADQIGRQLAKHLAHSGVFRRVVYMPDLPGTRFDHRLRSTVVRFRGCRETRDNPHGSSGAEGNMWVGFGEVVLDPIEVIEAKTAEVRWRGTARGDHREDGFAMAVASAADQADNALKAAVASLAAQIAEDPVRPTIPRQSPLVSPVPQISPIHPSGPTRVPAEQVRLPRRTGSTVRTSSASSQLPTDR